MVIKPSGLASKTPANPTILNKYPRSDLLGNVGLAGVLEANPEGLITTCYQDDYKK